MRTLLFLSIDIFIILMLSVSCGLFDPTFSDYNKPSAPYSVNATDGTYADKITITWSGSTYYQFKEFTVYRSESINGTYTKLATTVNTYYSDTTVEFNKYYFYKISKVSQDDLESNLSSADSGYSDNSPGTLYIDASNGDSTQPDKITITWTNDANSISYCLYRSISSSSGPYELIAEISNNTYEDTNVIQGKYYYYKVQGKSAFPTLGSMSGSDNGYTPFQAPENVQATMGVYLDKITVTWNLINEFCKYKIYRSSTETGYYSQIGIVEKNINTYNDTDSTVTSNPGVSYYYKVSGYDNYTGQYSSFAVGSISAMPTNVQATDGAYYQGIMISWNHVSGASYKVYRSDSENGTYTELVTVGSSVYSCFDNSAVEGQTYFYKVTGIKNGYESLKSASDSGYRKPSTENMVFRVRWDPNKEKAVNSSGGGYRIYYSPTSNFDIAGASYYEVSYSQLHYDFIFNSSQIGTVYVKVAGFSTLGGSINIGTPSAEQTIIIK